MEFGVATFSAVVGLAIQKLCTVASKLKGQPETDATLMKDELTSIQAAIRRYSPFGGYEEGIAQLRRLAYDIEDCIDCFDANKTSHADFAKQIAALYLRSTETAARIRRYIFPADQGTVRHAQVDADVPAELQNLGDNMECLLYLCLFPPNRPVRTKPLMRRWLAEGVVQAEQFAVKNLGIFVGKPGIINSISIQRSNNGKVKMCQPTDEMHQYISQRSVSEDFILVCDGAVELKAEGARRLSVHPCANHQLILPKDLSRLRTLAVFPARPTNVASYGTVLDFTRYKVLRVLDLKECPELSAQHLTDLWNQVLMKYLSINVGSIGKITRKIGDLEQLETLDLSGSGTVTVYKEVLLPRLKHLFGKFQLSIRDTLQMYGIRGRIPQDLEKFLKDKSVLETMAWFVTGKRRGFPQLMSLMWRLRKVKILCKPNATKENLTAISKAITKFIHDDTCQPDLNRSLSIDFHECSGEFLDTIEADARSGTLTSLKLQGKLSQFPQFVRQLTSIEELCLWSTGLSWAKIVVGLANLRILKYLKLIEDDLQSIQIESQHLKSTERLCFVSNKTLQITVQAKALIHLVSLHILCQDLHVIPGTSGIQITQMARLKEIALHPQVPDNIKTMLEDAARDHPSKPTVLFIEDP